MTGFNQVVIKLQLILDIAFCDYAEEKKKTYATGFLPCRASRGIMDNSVENKLCMLIPGLKLLKALFELKKLNYIIQSANYYCN